VNGAALVLLSGGRGLRPQPVSHAAIAPPFDPSDGDGIVHTTLPPEQVIPPHFTDPLFMRADFNGVTIDLSRWNPGAPEPLPFLSGANSTPLAMLMTPMLIMYPDYWQDADLTEHAERGYDDFVTAPNGWNMPENGFPENSLDKLLPWHKKLKAWGFRTVYWQGNYREGLTSVFEALLDAGVIDFFIYGKEVDTMPGGTSEEFEAALHNVNDYLGGRIPIGVHFSADGDRHMGYPIGWTRDTYLNDWSPFNGRVHLMQQMSVEASAGKQGASMYYARRWINLGAKGGVDGAKGPGAPDSRCIAFETMAIAQLYGKCDESYGNLRNWEMLCGVRDNPACLPVSGYGNGCRYPNGDPL
jgi:hypothetical protein